MSSGRGGVRELGRWRAAAEREANAEQMRNNNRRAEAALVADGGRTWMAMQGGGRGFVNARHLQRLGDGVEEDCLVTELWWLVTELWPHAECHRAVDDDDLLLCRVGGGGVGWQGGEAGDELAGGEGRVA